MAFDTSRIFIQWDFEESRELMDVIENFRNNEPEYKYITREEFIIMVVMRFCRRYRKQLGDKYVECISKDGEFY